MQSTPQLVPAPALAAPLAERDLASLLRQDRGREAEAAQPLSRASGRAAAVSVGSRSGQSVAEVHGDEERGTLRQIEAGYPRNAPGTRWSDDDELAEKTRSGRGPTLVTGC
jgi:hypothetical protein